MDDAAASAEEKEKGGDGELAEGQEEVDNEEGAQNTCSPERNSDK